MYKRFKESIVSPKNIVEFRTDSLVKVFIYILLFSMLLGTRTIIEVATFKGLTPSYRETLKQEFHVVDESCLIVDANVECDVSENTLIYEDLMLSYYIDSRNEIEIGSYGENYNIIFHKDGIHFILNKTAIYEMKISELPSEFHNIDFGLQTTDPNVFYNDLFDAIDSLFISSRNIWAPMIIAIDVFTSFVMFLVFILISAWMLKMRFKPVRFKEMFVMTSYSSTALYIILILNSLYDMSFFIVIILVIAAFRQNNQLSMEIHRRLNKNLDK
jgi:hypothetical protein